MNCEIAHERIVAAAYGELPDEQIHELERHMTDCQECEAERKQLLALKVLVDAYPVMEVDANLVARSRLKLEEALDSLPARHWYEVLGQRLLNNFARLQGAPVAAALLLVAGIGAGSLGGYELAANRASRAAYLAATAQAHAAKVGSVLNEASGVQALASPAEFGNIASVSSIVKRPNSEMVEVSYNQVVPQRIEGSLDDPAIRQLLMLASQNSTSAGGRDNSVELLASECKAGHSCQPAGIRDALMVALRYDRNAGVRLKALQGLEPYVAEDVRVRNAVLEALMNDSDLRVRTAAINIVEPVEADTSVRQVLNSVSNSDRNLHIRTVSRQALDRMPEIQ